MLDFGFCFQPFPYKKRNVRFGIDFFTVPDYDTPKIPSELLHFKNFAFNKEKKRVSFTLPDGSVQRCQFSTKLITNDPSAEKFLDIFLEFNPSLKGKAEYYVFDEDGLDIPMFPGATDIKKGLGLDSETIIPVVLFGLGLAFFLKRKK